MLTKQKLIELGFKPNCKGFHYLYDAINLTIENPFIKIGVIYNKLAKKYNESYSKIERAIRHVIETSNTIYKDDCNSIVFAILAINFSKEE